MQNPYYLDFYRKKLIPAESNSATFLLDQFPNLSPPSYWLIALEGKPNPTQRNSYDWRISVFASDINGYYDASSVLYSSEYFPSIDKALEASRQLEKRLQSPELQVLPLQNKIS